MAQARVAPAISPRVIVIASAPLAATAIEALAHRGIDARAHDVSAGDISVDDTGVIAWALEAAPGSATAAELADTCERAARAGRPVCLLAPLPRGTTRAAIERMAALAYLRAFGAALAHDVDAWLEAVVLLVRFGLPAGPRAAVIAPPGSWLEAQTVALTTESELAGGRSPFATTDEPTDVVLYDPALGPPPRSTPGLAVPVVGRGELAGDAIALHGARSALAAIAILGRAAERIDVGLGPAPRSASAELSIDQARLERQLAEIDKLSNTTRIGDHETKTLLAAYGAPITRQAVATSPSMAIKKARLVGLPVQMKPFGQDVPSEPDGCPVERELTSDSMVRQAYGSVLSALNKAIEGNAVIVRETPPRGREVRVSFLRLPSLGWTVILDAPGAPQIAAAPAPLRLIDATALAAQVVASRAGEPEPDRPGLANLLRRASHLVVDLDRRLVALELPRVVIGGRGARTVVVDAYADLA